MPLLLTSILGGTVGTGLGDFELEDGGFIIRTGQQHQIILEEADREKEGVRENR